MTSIASNLQIDSARLWDTIHATAKFGATAKGGVRRLTLVRKGSTRSPGITCTRSPSSAASSCA